MKVIVIAGGEGKRWNNFLGTRKHFAPINGEAIIDRLVRMYAPLGHITFITVPGWELAHKDVTSVHVEPGLEEKWFDIAKIAATIPYWSKDECTLVLLGDVYWTEDGVSAVKDHVTSPFFQDWFMYGRLTKSNVKKHHPSNENFAMSFYPEHHNFVLESMHKSVKLFKKKEIRWNKMSQLYRIMCGKDGADADLAKMPQEDLGHFITINDLTDDVDWRDDILDYWKKLNTKELHD